MQTWYRNIDYVVLATWLALVAIGLTAIYSITNGAASEYLSAAVQQSFNRQFTWALICTGVIGIALMLPVRFYQNAAYPLYAVGVVLLAVTIFAGHEAGGSRRWLRIGPIQLQIGELAKVTTLLAVARLLSSKRPDASNIKYAMGAVGLLTIPVVLLIMQNDTGTALVYLGLAPIMLFWSGLPLSVVALMISPLIAGYLAIVYLPAAVAFALIFTLGMYWKTSGRLMPSLAAVFTGGTIGVMTVALAHVFRPHQVARIISFTNPGAEEFRSGVGFHLVQSKAAIGSGGIWGKGFREGTQTQGAYIPEQSTDFIFSVIGEEFGFVGAMIVLVLFAVLLIRLIWLGTQVKHPFGSMMAAGVVGVFLIHILINVGMVTGLSPVIGVPLPLISYGGSALLAYSAMVAIVLNLHMRRNDFSIYGY